MLLRMDMSQNRVLGQVGTGVDRRSPTHLSSASLIPLRDAAAAAAAGIAARSWSSSCAYASWPGAP
jgi:hypothetical protein